MDDDWRIQVDPAEEEHGSGLIGHLLEPRELEHDLSDAFHDRVIVSRDGQQIFLYAGTREQAEAADELIDRLAQEHGWTLKSELRRWHPDAEEWEDPALPPPHSEAERRAEHAQEIAVEDERVRAQGYPEYEVRVEFPSHHDALDFSRRLRDEGFEPVRRWKYLVVGALDEDQANDIARRLGEEAPQASQIRVEGTWQAARAESPPNPFAIFGGLGG